MIGLKVMRKVRQVLEIDDIMDMDNHWMDLWLSSC